MAKKVLLMSQCLGVRTKGNFLVTDLESGKSELSDAVNVFIDGYGKVKRRGGSARVSSRTGLKSGFSNGGEVLVQVGGSLFRVDDGLGLTGIRSGMDADKKISFAQAGSKVYYTMTGYNGVIDRGGQSNPWEVQDYVGPRTIRGYSSPPKGSLLEVFGSRMYVAEGRVLWYSEPNWYAGFDLSQNFIEHDSDITMLLRFENGLVVGTEYKTYMYLGTGPEDFKQKVIDIVPPIEGSGVRRPLLIGDRWIRSLLWLSETGLMTVQEDGTVVNLLVNKVDIPEGRTGGSYLVGDYYVCSLEDTGIIVNLLNGAVSWLSNFEYQTLFKSDKRYLGGNDDGLYEVLSNHYDKDEEEDVEAWITLPKSDWGVSRAKGIRALYVNGEFDKIRATCKTATGETTVESQKSVYKQRQVVVAPGCGLQGADWEIKISNVDGGCFEINSVSCLPIVLGKYAVGSLKMED